MADKRRLKQKVVIKQQVIGKAGFICSRSYSD